MNVKSAWATQLWKTQSETSAQKKVSIMSKAKNGSNSCSCRVFYAGEAFCLRNFSVRIKNGCEFHSNLLWSEFNNICSMQNSQYGNVAGNKTDGFAHLLKVDETFRSVYFWPELTQAPVTWGKCFLVLPKLSIPLLYWIVVMWFISQDKRPKNF